MLPLYKNEIAFLPLGTDLNGRVGKGNKEDEEVMGSRVLEREIRVDGCGFCQEDGFGGCQHLFQEERRTQGNV